MLLNHLADRTSAMIYFQTHISVRNKAFSYPTPLIFVLPNMATLHNNSITQLVSPLNSTKLHFKHIPLQLIKINDTNKNISITVPVSMVTNAVFC